MKILKIFFLIILGISILGAIYFLSKWNKINIDKNIGKSINIKNLDKKVFDQTYLIFDSTKVTTDFELFKNQNDTVTFSFSASKSPKSRNITLLNFNHSNGFTGVNINVTKFENHFFTSTESYTDNIGIFDFLKPEELVVKNQKLTLNKSEYKKGDSIFGKIELEIKSTPNNEMLNSKGYFRGVVK
ncbi:hypothetical protein JSO61_007030 [Riemerella anatipestifer]|uniref:hypothetical protein n=1 Tax=Riemerella anatipestifer TaxID=34085 RepID=UPI002A849294|nr:hypothetical protein [Riemerella anatipestifer]